MHTHHYNLGLLSEESMDKHARRPALRYPGRDYLYQDLAEFVDVLAALLIARGIRQGDVIAIGHDKRPLSYALMLAALRLGVPYVNIDVASPQARTQRILEVSGAKFLFYDDSQREPDMQLLAAAHGCPLILLDEADLVPIKAEERAEQCLRMRRVDGETIAYIMFTSGSTGIPKGVAVTHQNVLHFIEWGRARFGITEQDNFANLSPMYFDNSVFDFFVALFSGAALTPISRELLAKPYDLTAHVAAMNCTIWFSVPSLLIYLMTMKALSAETPSSLRAIVFGGEGYPKSELRKLYGMFCGRTELVNVYGPTECTCICSAHTLTAEDFKDLAGLPTLGCLNQNFDYRILDEHGNDAESGELCLIGPNVAAGYFNDAERTAAAFQTLTDPNRFMKRMYRTGDLVEAVEGRLYFLGRKDNQIKHMGYRIELEEIECGLARVAGVDQAVVLYRRLNAAYGKIYGFVASRDGAEESEVLEALSELLPSYMVPSRIVVMTELPKNANGKVDRQALLASLNDH